MIDQKLIKRQLEPNTPDVTRKIDGKPGEFMRGTVSHMSNYLRSKPGKLEKPMLK